MSKATAAGAPPGRLSLLSVLAFACAYMPFAALQLSVAVQLPPFFASQLGLGLAAGAAFGIVRLIDIPVDPALGLFMDKTRTGIGRYRPWMMAGVPILMLALYMLYQAPPGISQGYLILWLLVIYLGMSILLVAGNAWASTLATTYKERSRIFGAMLALGVIGSVTSLMIPVIFETTHRTELAGMRAVGWFLLALSPLAVLIAVAKTPERVVAARPGQKFGIGDYFSLLSRGNVLRILAADFCVTMGPGWMAALYFFYYRQSRGLSLSGASLLLTLYILAGLVGGPATAWLGNRISKHRALVVTTTLYALMLIIIPILPPGKALLYAPPMFCLGGLATGFVVMVRAITADVGDELRLEGGRDLIGLLYAVTSATTKAAGALSIFVSFWLLGVVGFNVKAHAVNGPAQIHGLELVFVIGPIAFVMLGGASFLGYRLSADKHADIRRQLDERDAVYAESPITQAVTGGAME
ncbi:MFS transporter [Phenylobacterium sp.]|uniref:MFS transporter n=1 Tax=Phenylobacterium sp. TaxID=1871053 RepID=UPI002DF0C30A|nr:MFS transporter [Phenylobacterium sp.]